MFGMYATIRTVAQGGIARFDSLPCYYPRYLRYFIRTLPPAKERSSSTRAVASSTEKTRVKWYIPVGSVQSLRIPNIDPEAHSVR
jgi:hypothetical protein